MLPAKLFPIGYRDVAAGEADKPTCAYISAIPRVVLQRLSVDNHRSTREQFLPSLNLCHLLLLSLRGCSAFFPHLIPAVSDNFNNFVLRGASCSSCSTTGLLYDWCRRLGGCRSNLRSHRNRRSGLMHHLCSSFDLRILNLTHHCRHSCYCLCNILPVHTDPPFSPRVSCQMTIYVFLCLPATPTNFISFPEYAPDSKRRPVDNLIDNLGDQATSYTIVIVLDFSGSSNFDLNDPFARINAAFCSDDGILSD